MVNKKNHNSGFPLQFKLFIFRELRKPKRFLTRKEKFLLKLKDLRKDSEAISKFKM